MKNFKDFLTTESILDPVKDTLAPEIWMSNGKLKPSVKSFIVKRIEVWLQGMTSKKLKGVYILGSITGYQYGPDTDIDTNIVVDISDERLKELTKLLPNGHNVPGTDHPVNYYMVNNLKADWYENADGIYDVVNDKWIRKQDKKEITKADTATNFKAVSEIARFFIIGIDAAISEYNMDVASYKTFKNYYEDTNDKIEKEDLKENMMQKLFEITADIDGILIAHHMVHSLRKEVFAGKHQVEIKTEIKAKNTNMSINNLIYKYMEKLDYFDKIAKIEDKADYWEQEKNRLAKMN